MAVSKKTDLELLHETLCNTLNEAEFAQYCRLKLNIDLEMFVSDGADLSKKIDRLIGYMKRKGRLPELCQKAVLWTEHAEFKRILQGIASRQMAAGSTPEVPTPIIYLIAHSGDSIAQPLIEFLDAVIGIRRCVMLSANKHREFLRGKQPDGTQVIVGLLTGWSLTAPQVVYELAGTFGSGLPMALLLGPGTNEFQFDLPKVEERYFRLNDMDSISSLPDFLQENGVSLRSSLKERQDSVLRFHKSCIDNADTLAPLAHVQDLVNDLLWLASSRQDAFVEPLLNALSQIGFGSYYIIGRDEIYRHDMKVIESLKLGDEILATHPITDNPGEIAKGAAFRNYTNSQLDAAKRGVVVRRLYIFESGAQPTTQQLDHLRALYSAGVQIRIYPQEPLSSSPVRGMARDFVMLGPNCLGFGIPDEGPMVGSRYHIGIGESVKGTTEEYKKIFNNYKKWFDELWKASTDYPSQYDISSPSPIRIPGILPVMNSGRVIVEPAIIDTASVSIGGKPSTRLMVVFRTGGCDYDADGNGCKMCEFRKHAIDTSLLTRDNLEQLLLQQFNQVEAQIRRDSSIGQVDLLTLGSFLSNHEVPMAATQRMFRALAQLPQVRRIVIESRTQHVYPESLRELRSYLTQQQILELGVGVETSDQDLRDALNKGMSDILIQKAIDSCSKSGVDFMAYLLVGTPTLTEAQAINDAVRSCNTVRDWCESKSVRCRISFEPVFITDKLKKNYPDYKLISLWSVVEVISRTASAEKPTFVGLNDENLSNHRKPRAGCERCDGAVVRAIEKFNGSQEVSSFFGLENLDCSCLDAWRSATGISPSWIQVPSQ